MTILKDPSEIIGHFCRHCGQFFASRSTCPSCGKPLSNASNDQLSVPVHLSVLICSSCQHVMSIGTPSCPVCGEIPSSEEPTDPRDRPVNRAKLKALGDLLPRFESASQIASSSTSPPAALTDEQFFAFMTRNNLISERLLEDIRITLERIDLTTSNAIRSAATRRAMEELLAAAETTRSIYDDAAAVSVPEQFSGVHLLLLSLYQGLLDLRLALARAILAITLEETQACQQAIQESLDRLGLLAQTMADEIDQVDPEGVVFDQVNRRLAAFVGQARQYEHAGQADLAAALSAGLGESGDFRRLGELGAAYFGSVLPVDPAVLPVDQGVILYTLAAEVAALEDPLTVRRTASVLLGLYNDAFQLDPGTMTSSLVASEADAEVAVSHMLSLGDRMRIPRQEELPLEAARQELASIYVTLTEWIYRRLLNLPLAAKSVVQGQAKPYADISNADFGAKVNELTQTSDPRYAPALLGVSTIARNAGAHGDADTSGAKIVLRKRDRKGRVDIEELTDADFMARLENLSLTCRALVDAAGLLRIQHHQHLPAPNPVVQRRLVAEQAPTVVGLFGLVRARVSSGEEDRIVVEADEDEARTGLGARDYLTSAFTLATLFPHSSKIDLRVFRAGHQVCRIEAPVAEVQAYQSVPKHANAYTFLKLCYLSVVEGDDTTEPARIVRELIRPGSRLLMNDLAALGRLRGQLPGSRDDYRTALYQTMENLEGLSTVLKSLTLPLAAVGPRDSLLVGLDALEQGLSYHQSLAQSGRWNALKQPNRQLQRGARILGYWT